MERETEENNMREPYLYFDIDKEERDSAIRYLLNAILRSRVESNLSQSVEEFDEDVNIYLAHLLLAVSLPEYHELAQPYLSNDSSDVLRWVKGTEDRTIRYFIFKVNADHLLIHLSVFDDLAEKSRRSLFRPSEKHFIELGRLYYEQASNYHSRIYRKRTGVGDVLEKLARHFDIYSELLRTVRRDYLHFVTTFRDQVFNRFMQDMTRYEREAIKKTKIDHFLDLYSQWLRTKDPHLHSETHRLLRELREMEPDFGKGFLGEIQ